ncbi:hypothetical protein HXX76_000648 [Chlamydomonas incerta]|uniref:Uncharacterized protein n=1 Tax=Chlamydomonas incerta TaxID=51695 RepID=A0A836B2T4_CHLIN|nr:hypothetical protein HXX76_000648 [Chlamydomonas incerta]|eukprot:KAG2446046.1 hypothetical protein HXX76_000648 [Chlamydomonas incerta]
MEGLRVQLEQERAERARLQEQLDTATDLLRKSYGQIVDDYLFATEQLHMRTRQLEELLTRQAAGSAAMQAGEAEAAVAKAAGSSSLQRPEDDEVPQETSAAWPGKAAASSAAVQASGEANTGATAAAADVGQGVANSASEHTSSSSQHEGPWGSSPASGQSREAATAGVHSAHGGCEEVDAGPSTRDAAAKPEDHGPEAQQTQSEWVQAAHLQEHSSAPEPRRHLPTKQHPSDLELPAPRRRSDVTVWAVGSPPASSPIREVSDSFAADNDGVRPATAATFAAAAAPAMAPSPYAGAYPSPGLSSLFAGADSDASTPPPNYPPSVAASICSPFSMPASCARVFGARAGGRTGGTAAAVAVDAAAAAPGASAAGRGAAAAATAAAATAAAATAADASRGLAQRGEAAAAATSGRAQVPQGGAGHQHPQQTAAEEPHGTHSPVFGKREGPAGKRLRRSISSPIEDPASLWGHLANAAGSSSANGAQGPVAPSVRAGSAVPLRPGSPPGEPSQAHHLRKSAQGSSSDAGEKEAAAARGRQDGSPQLRRRRDQGPQEEGACAGPQQREAGDVRAASLQRASAAARNEASSSPGHGRRPRHGAAAMRAAPAGAAEPLRAGSSPAARSHSKDSGAGGSGNRPHATSNVVHNKAAHRNIAAGTAKGAGSGGGAAGDGGAGKPGAAVPAPAGSSGSGASGLSYSSSLDGLASMVRDLRQQLEGLQREFRRGEGEEEAHGAGGHGDGDEEAEGEAEEEEEDEEDGVADSYRRWVPGVFTPDSSGAQGGYQGGAAKESDSGRHGRGDRHDHEAGRGAASSSSASSNSSRPAPVGGFSPVSPYSPYAKPYASAYYDTASSSAGTSPAPGSATRHSTLPHGIDISPVAAYLREQRHHQHEHTGQCAGGAGGARREPASHLAPSAAPRTFGAKAGTGSAAPAAAHASSAPLRSPLQQQPAINRFRSNEAAGLQPARPAPPSEGQQAVYGDRTLPPDQTGPRKASAAVAAAAAGHKAAAGHSAGEGAAAAAGLRGGAARGDPLFPLNAPSHHSHGLGGSRADQHSAAAAVEDAGPGSAAAKLQGLRSEAMFARIKQQLDELQSSFTLQSAGPPGGPGAAVGPGHSMGGGGGLGLGAGADGPGAGLHRGGPGGSGARVGGLR